MTFRCHTIFYSVFQTPLLFMLQGYCQEVLGTFIGVVVFLNLPVTFVFLYK